MLLAVLSDAILNITVTLLEPELFSPESFCMFHFEMGMAAIYMVEPMNKKKPTFSVRA
jgi:hypothetical protein